MEELPLLYIISKDGVFMMNTKLLKSVKVNDYKYMSSEGLISTDYNTIFSIDKIKHY
jgi:hypothetical protein